MSFASWAEVYDERARRFENPLDICEFYSGDRPCDEAWFRGACDLVADALELRPEDRVLEVGCGCGVLMSRLIERGGTFVGVDPAAAVLAKAASSVPRATFHQASAESLPEADAQFDKCYSYQVIHYFGDYEAAERAILEMRRVVKPGGRILLGQVPNAEMHDLYQERRRARSFARDGRVAHSLRWLWYSPEFFMGLRDRFSEVEVRRVEHEFDPIYRYRMDVVLVV
jgi:ubiquinone/menaquinone biosynthesis C-methylase UbiE